MRFLRADSWRWFGLTLALVVAGCQFLPPSVDSGEAVLIDLMAQRLAVARDVAWSKFNTGAPVLDAPRENAVVAVFVGQATQAGIEAGVATAFFTAQIAASRAVQTELIEAWNRGAAHPATAPPDLVAVIRPRLDAIGEKMVAALAAQPPRAGDTRRVAAAKTALELRGFSAAVARLAAQGLGGAANYSRRHKSGLKNWKDEVPRVRIRGAKHSASAEFGPP